MDDPEYVPGSEDIIEEVAVEPKGEGEEEEAPAEEEEELDEDGNPVPKKPKV